MGKAVQFSIGLDNTAGTLAKLCRLLRRGKVNLEAISVADNTDCGWVRIVATPSGTARALLHKAGYTVCAQLVMVREVEDRPGELERVASKLAKAGVNVNYVYGSTPRGGRSALVFGVDDVNAAVEAVGA